MPIKFYHEKKNKKFKTDIMTSFILLLKSVLTIIFEINEKKKTIQTQAVLTLLTDANLKNFLYSVFCDDAIPLHNLKL